MSITLFSFPHGQYDDYILSKCRQSGYSRVYSILPEQINFDNEKYVRGRIDVDPGDWSIEFYLKIVGAYLWLPKAFHLKKQLINVVEKLRK